MDRMRDFDPDGIAFPGFFDIGMFDLHGFHFLREVIMHAFNVDRLSGLEGVV